MATNFCPKCRRGLTYQFKVDFSREPIPGKVLGLYSIPGEWLFMCVPCEEAEANHA